MADHIDIDIDALERAARAATPGGWADDGWQNVGASYSDQINGGHFVAECCGPDRQKNMTYIAAANPAAVLELIRRLRDAEQERDALRAELEDARRQAPVAWGPRAAIPFNFGQGNCVEVFGSAEHLLSEYCEADPMPLYAAPVLAAPSVPGVLKFGPDEEKAFNDWFRSEQWNPYSGMWEFARAAWMARASSTLPAAPSVPDFLLRSRVSDLLHLLQYAEINTSSAGDVELAVKAMDDLRAMLAAPNAGLGIPSCSGPLFRDDKNHPLCRESAA